MGKIKLTAPAPTVQPTAPALAPIAPITASPTTRVALGAGATDLRPAGWR
jgi:hypothetical protein